MLLTEPSPAIFISAGSDIRNKKRADCGCQETSSHPDPTLSELCNSSTLYSALYCNWGVSLDLCVGIVSKSLFSLLESKPCVPCTTATAPLQLGPLGRVGLVVAMSVCCCRRTCVSSSHAIFFR